MLTAVRNSINRYGALVAARRAHHERLRVLEGAVADHLERAWEATYRDDMGRAADSMERVRKLHIEWFYLHQAGPRVPPERSGT
jgi:hypothetical protein